MAGPEIVENGPFKVELQAQSGKLGEDLALTVTVTNSSDEVAQGPELSHDLLSISILMQRDERQHLFSHRAEENYSSPAPELVDYEPQESKTLELTLPAVEAGEWNLQAGYRFSPEGAALSETVALTVTGKDDQELVCRIQSSAGEMVMRFFPEQAMNHVLHFVQRAKAGLYDGTLFHRVIPDFMIQGGDPDGNGTGGPGYVLPAEFNDLPHQPGRLSAARRQDPNSAGCQFFLCHGTPSYLDGQYTVFGEVFEGLEVVDAIAAVETGAADRPVEDQVMETLTVEVR